MSQTFSLICDETEKRVWIGQGWGQMDVFYTGEPHTMESLKRFLNEHIDKPIRFLCDDKNDRIFDYEEYEHLNRRKPMAEKKVIKGELLFKEVTPTQVKFDFDSNNKILSNRNFDVVRKMVPADFEHGLHDVKATYLITIETMEK